MEDSELPFSTRYSYIFEDVERRKVERGELSGAVDENATDPQPRTEADFPDFPDFPRARPGPFSPAPQLDPPLPVTCGIEIHWLVGVVRMFPTQYL